MGRSRKQEASVSCAGHHVVMKKTTARSQKMARKLLPVQSAGAATAAQATAETSTWTEDLRVLQVFRSEQVQAVLKRCTDWFMTGKPEDQRRYCADLDAIMTRMQTIPKTMNGTDLGLPRIVIVHQPEKMVRSRYKSEGCRAPIKGLENNSFPSAKVENYDGPVMMVAHLETIDGEPHPNTLIQSTSNEDQSKEIMMPSWIDSIAVKCSQDMVAKFDNLAIRRLNKDAVSKLRMQRQSKYTKANANDDGVIVFRAFLPGCTVPFDTVKTAPFACVVPAEPAVVELVHPNIGGASGGDVVVLVGRKYKAGFIVTFTDGDWSERGEVLKQVSNQNSAVVRIPPYKMKSIAKRVDVEVYVTTGPAKEPLRSDGMTFTYAPEVERNAMGLYNPAAQHGKADSALGVPPATPSSMVPASEVGSALFEDLTMDSYFSSPMKAADMQPSPDSVATSLSPDSGLGFLLLNEPAVVSPAAASQSPLLDELLAGSDVADWLRQSPELFAPSAAAPEMPVGHNSPAPVPTLAPVGLPSPPPFGGDAGFPFSRLLETVNLQAHMQLEEGRVDQWLAQQQQQQQQLKQEQLDEAWQCINKQVTALCSKYPSDDSCQMMRLMAEKRDRSMLIIYEKALSVSSPPAYPVDAVVSDLLSRAVNTRRTTVAW